MIGSRVTSWPTRPSSARERRQRQQAVARRRRGQQGGEVAVGLAGPGRGGNGYRAVGAAGHVSRDAPPPPWPA